jgi:hypothetical protein
MPQQSMMLTVKLEGAPAVHLAYDHGRPFEETAVTVLGHGASRPLDFQEVVWQALVFVLNYFAARHKWPAELRAPGAGRSKTDEVP